VALALSRFFSRASEYLGLDGLGLGLGDGCPRRRACGCRRRRPAAWAAIFGRARLGEGGLVGLVVAVLAVAIHVDDDVALELHAELEGERATMQTASGSSPFTWKIGASIILATSVQ
jgi:hypothetical protein